MPNQFTAQVFQNEYVPAGSGEVHAIMTVTAAEQVVASAPQGRLFGIICDCSGSMEGQKIVAAKNAIMKLIELLPSDCGFFVIAGEELAHVISPLSLATAAAKQQAVEAVRRIIARGGTLISKWLLEARRQFELAPGTLRQALLLTDGQNEDEDAVHLIDALSKCEGAFQCDCRGVGTDWKVEQLRAIANKMLGSTDMIPTPAQIEADFRNILSRAMSKSVGDVYIRLWTPQGSRVKFCKEVSPHIADLTSSAQQRKPLTRDYPTGAWAQNETRDYHFCIEVQPGGVGDEVLAGRASLISIAGSTETKFAEGRILAIWTDDEAKSTKINRVVAHYTGQAELAQSIQDGIEARGRGDTERATALLGKAVRIAHESGNEATEKLLRKVVDVEDPATGTVRLKRSVAKEDEMMLETRSTKTTRVVRQA
ncbi:MAG: VWA domain-containing protein [Acidobacteriaceae bacterium]|nr:VWA domain-containing protein [Acidobacteriaceae bacterium]